MGKPFIFAAAGWGGGFLLCPRAAHARGEGDYPRKMLGVRMSEAGAGETPGALEAQIFSRESLLERPLLRAITRPDQSPVLLIDEIDRADSGFEAFLLELLADFQVTIPE